MVKASRAHGFRIVERAIASPAGSWTPGSGPSVDVACTIDRRNPVTSPHAVEVAGYLDVSDTGGVHSRSRPPGGRSPQAGSRLMRRTAVQIAVLGLFAAAPVSAQ
jgi:hypothetical protein